MTLLIFIFILGLIVFVHELGHFIFAKRAKIYCYEFSLGMGPKLFSFNRKNDETVYSLRLLPIGGFVRLAGEDEDSENIKESDKLQSKTFLQRFLTMSAGIIFNFIFGILLLIVLSFIFGTNEVKPIVGELSEDYNVYKSGIREDDIITKVNGKKTPFTEDVMIYLNITEKKLLEFEVKRGKEVLTFEVLPSIEIIDGEETELYGLSLKSVKQHGFFVSIKYGVVKFFSIISSMIKSLFYLITGKISANNLSGPVGIYSIVGESRKLGIENLVYLVSLISINIGFVNLIPFPAFDGGRLLFLLIEKIRKKPIKSEVENMIHNIGFGLLIILMIFVTYKDVVNLFK